MGDFEVEFKKAFGRPFKNKKSSVKTGFKHVRKTLGKKYKFRYTFYFDNEQHRLERKSLLGLKNGVVSNGWDWGVDDKDLAIQTVKQENIEFKDIFDGDEIWV